MLRSLFTQITRLSLKFRWITILLTVAFLVLGVVAATQLNQEFLPSIEFPQTFVVTFRPGATSEDLRDLVTVPLEQEFAKLRGVIPEGLESTTSAPVSFLTVRSEYGVSLESLRAEMQTTIDRVIAEGVPVGLQTTADLTPEIMTRVLTKAPTMWQHFESRHLLAMSPEVLNAALAVNPQFLEEVDLLARDQLAAARVSQAVTGTATAAEPVQLPSAWRVTTETVQGGEPRIITFSLSDLPVITSSVFSDEDTTPAQLKELVQRELVDRLSTVEGVASASLSGGQEIPQEVLDAALRTVNANTANGETGSETGGTPAQPTPAPVTNPGTGNAGNIGAASNIPALPDAWRTARLGPLSVPSQLPNQLKDQFGTTARFDTADDLLKATDADGNTLPVATLLNQIAQIPNSNLVLRTGLPADVLAYVRTQAPGYVEELSDEALLLVGSSSLNSGAWQQLLTTSGVQAVGINTLADLSKLKGSAAATINGIVTGTPENLRSFAIRIVDALTPEAILALTRQDANFAANLDPQALRFMNADALKALPAGFIEGLSDAALRDELNAILADPAKAAINTLQQGGSEVVDDPNAPAMPANLTEALAGFGISVKTANDVFKPPFNSPASFFNQLAERGAGPLFTGITPEIMLYLGNRDPNFFRDLRPETLALLPEATLKALPAEVQARVQTGPSFEPTTTVTRTNGRESLLISIRKDKGANTVAVSDRIEEVFREVQANNREIQITTVFEQASFIRESIDGVVREGGLGALGAVLVILFFLNFSVRSTLVTAVSIPASIAIALVLMRWVPSAVHGLVLQAPEGAVGSFLLRLFPETITLNIMTLSGLTVAIGRVVDDAIVVLENIYRQLQSGRERREAVIKGTRDVSVAIFAATLTTVVVFLPIGLTGGIIGEFFLPFGLAVTYALIASFFVAITIVPVLALLFIDPQHMPEEKKGRLESIYHGAIQWALNHRFAVMAIATVTLFIGLALFATRPTTFLPSLGEPQISTTISLPPGTPLAQTDVRVREFEKFLDSKHDAGVKQYQVTVGSGGAFGDIAALIGGGGGVNGSAASVTSQVEVTGEALNALTQEVRAEAERIFGADNVTVSRASISEQGFGGFGVVISGPEADMRAVDARVVEALSQIPGLTNVSSSLSLVGDAQSYLRVGGQPAVQYTAELEATDTLGITRQAIAAVRALPDLPASLTVGEGFQSQQQTEGFTQTFGAMGIAVLAVYVVMLFTFGSFLHPFTILFSLPLAVVGAAFLLTITNRVVGISALVGMLMLIGIVVTNAIVLIDRVQQNRKDRGMSPKDALIEGGETRLRPILMTALATMVALSPLALGLSKGAIIATELGTVVIGGLFSSTFLTLLVVPVVYSLFDALQRRIFGGGTSKPKRGEAAAD